MPRREPLSMQQPSMRGDLGIDRFLIFDRVMSGAMDPLLIQGYIQFFINSMDY